MTVKSEAPGGLPPVPLPVNEDDYLICTGCGLSVYPYTHDSAFTGWDVDKRGRCAACRWKDGQL